MALSPVPEATDLALPRARPAVQRPRATAELAEAREQLREALETIEAIRGGGIDSLVIGPPGQEQVYSVASADRTYRLIVEAMSEGAATISPRGVILDANPRLGSMTGNPAGHLIGTAVLDLISGADQAAFTRLLDVGIGDSARGEVELTGPGDTTVPVQLAVSGFDLDGMLLRCLVLTDLTAQHVAETQQAQAAAYNRSIIDASLNPLVVMGRDGVLTDLNVATERATGYGRADLIGTAFSDYFTEPDVARAGCERAFRDGGARDIALELRHRGGHTASLLYNAAVFRDAAGNVLGVMASARDVTQIRRAESALRESEQQHRALFHNAPIGICHLALSGEVILANRRLLEIVGFTSKELRSLPAGGIVHPDDRGADLASMQRVLSGEIDTFAAQKRYLHRDGDIIWVETNHTVIRDPDGIPQMFVATVRDLTAQTRR
jgi:PAS domain S-box-containing protein